MDSKSIPRLSSDDRLPVGTTQTLKNSDEESKSYFSEAKRSVAENGKDAYPLPPWLNPEKIHQGQKFVRDHFFSVFFAHFISLIFLLCYGPVRTILLRTGKSDTKVKSLKRYLSTLVHIKKWYELDILSESGEAAQDVKMVRKIHANVAKCIWKSDQITLNTKNDNNKISNKLTTKELPQKVSNITTATDEASHCRRSPVTMMEGKRGENGNGRIEKNNNVNNDVIVEEKEKELNYDDDVNFGDKSNLSSSTSKNEKTHANLIHAVQHDFTNVTPTASSSSSTMSQSDIDNNNCSSFNNNNNNNDNSYFPQLKRQDETEADNVNYVITQLDMLVTQFCFMGFVIMYPRQFGLSTTAKSNNNKRSNTTNAGLEGFIHLWALIGHLLGIDDKFNLCLDVNRHRIPSVLNNLLLPELTNCDLNTVTLWSSLIDGIASIIPFVSLLPILLFVRKLFVRKSDSSSSPLKQKKKNEDYLNNNSFTLISLLTNYDQVCFYLMDRCFQSWLLFDSCRLIFNNLLRLAVYLSEIRLIPKRGATKSTCIFSGAATNGQLTCPAQNLNLRSTVGAGSSCNSPPCPSLPLSLSV